MIADPPVYKAKVYKTEVVWHFEANGVEYRVVRKRDKFGEITGKTYVFTDADGFAYYATTSLAVFSQKYFLENMLNVKLEVEL